MDCLQIKYPDIRLVSPIDGTMINLFTRSIVRKLKPFEKELIACAGTVIMTVNSGMSDVTTELKHIPDELGSRILAALKKKGFDYSQN